MSDEELFIVRERPNKGEDRYVSAPMPLEAAIKHLWEVSRQSPAGHLHSVSVKNLQGDVIYQEHTRWIDWEHKELGEIWEPSKYNGKDPRAIAIVRALTGKKPLRPRKKKAVKPEATADVVALPTSRVRWTLGEVATGTSENVVSLSSAKATRKVASLIKGLDPDNLFAIPMSDITIGTDTPDAICSDDPIMLGAKALVAVKRLFLRFGIDETPATYGELKGGIAYCGALLRLGNNCSGEDKHSKLFLECTLEVVTKHSPELVEPLTAYVHGDAEGLKRLACKMPLAVMATHYGVVEACWMSYPLNNPLPMRVKPIKPKAKTSASATDAEIHNFGSAKMVRKLEAIAASMDPQRIGELFDIPMDDVTIGTDTPDAVCSDDPIILGAQAFVAVKRLFLAFGIEAVPVSYGELIGGISYCDALYRLSVNGTGGSADAERYLQGTLSIIAERRPELVEPLTAFAHGDIKTLRRLTGAIPLSRMAGHYDTVEECWMPYPPQNPLPMQAKP